MSHTVFQSERADRMGPMGRWVVGSLLGALVVLAESCGSDVPTMPLGAGGQRAHGGTGPTLTGGTSTGTGGFPIPPCSPSAQGQRTHTAGNYDNLSCRKPGCHLLEVGGWVYSRREGYPWEGGVTITIFNTDGTSDTRVSGEDGFFSFGQEEHITSPYGVCASKCPSTDCNVTLHTSVDCLAPGCHTSPIQRMYVTTPGAGGSGGTAGGPDCTPPASGGPYVHLETIYSAYNNLPCTGCHADPDYIGGFLYDGPTSMQTVAGATVTLTSANGTLTAVTGPGGMYFFGKYSVNTTPDALSPPFKPCVSKCPIGTICSPTDHTTTADCGTCHGMTRDKQYLR
jgi:hypothetical protein